MSSAAASDWVDTSIDVSTVKRLSPCSVVTKRAAVIARWLAFKCRRSVSFEWTARMSRSFAIVPPGDTCFPLSGGPPRGSGGFAFTIARSAR